VASASTLVPTPALEPAPASQSLSLSTLTLAPTPDQPDLSNVDPALVATSLSWKPDAFLPSLEEPEDWVEWNTRMRQRVLFEPPAPEGEDSEEEDPQAPLEVPEELQKLNALLVKASNLDPVQPDVETEDVPQEWAIEKHPEITADKETPVQRENPEQGDDSDDGPEQDDPVNSERVINVESGPSVNVFNIDMDVMRTEYFQFLLWPITRQRLLEAEYQVRIAISIPFERY